MQAWGTLTSFDVPVVPEVKIMYANLLLILITGSTWFLMECCSGLKSQKL